jgi:tetratricopeptide (TPR) repeat protein
VFLSTQDRFDEGVEEARRALEVDPLSLLFNLNLGWAFHQARKYAEAIDQAHHVLELDAGFHEAHALAAMVCEQLGDYPRAARYATGALQYLGAIPELAATLAVPLETESAEAYWRSRLAMIEKLPGAQSRMPNVVIQAYLGVGRIDAALDLMDRLVSMRDGHCVFFRTPVFDPLRGHPRYEAIVARVFGTPST